jgi:ubiquitin C-terminal hydrolase
MPQVKIEDLIDHLDSEFKKALDDTMREFAPTVQYDRTEFFKFFLKRVYHHCSIWEKVPDKLVKE